jgi:hypothetical protein
VAALVAWVAVPATGLWGIVLVATVVTILALVVDMTCLWRWDDSSLDLLASAGTALLTLILIVTVLVAVATSRLG